MMRSPITRQGGKYRLLKRLLPLVPDHRAYVEPFAGAAWLFFAKDQADIEVINDADGDLITFYRVVAPARQPRGRRNSTVKRRRDGIRSNVEAQGRAEIGPESVAPALKLRPLFERIPPILTQSAAVLK